MNVLEMWNRCLIESGQFLLDTAGVQLDQERFVTLVKSVTGFWNEQSPVTDKFNLSLQQGFAHTFNTNSNQYGIPEAIVSAVPLELAGTIPVGLFEEMSMSPTGSFFNHSPYSRGSTDKKAIPIEYRKPKLWVPVTGTYDIHAMYNHEVVKENGEWKVKTISHNDYKFHEFLRAKFLIAVGRSRRAFTIDELPIKTDASELVAEGLRLEETMKQEIKEDSDFYLAWG